MSKLNQRIIQARRQRKLSQANLAERLHVTRTAVSHWETGRSKPSTKHIERIAAALGVDASWLISGKKSTSSLSAPAQNDPEAKAASNSVREDRSSYGALFDRETFKVADAYFALNRTQRKIIRDMLKALGNLALVLVV